MAVVCRGEIIILDDDGPSDFNSIQAAVDDSNDGDIIYLMPGRYIGTGNRDIDFGGRAITVSSVAPEDPAIVAATVIDCNQLGRGFYFDSGEDGNSVVTGLTITNGYADYGGGIYCGSTSGPLITLCTITNNTATSSGGGIYSNYGTEGEFFGYAIKIIDCTISYNSASSDGGGLANCDSATGCSIIGNSADGNGGGIYSTSEGTAIANCTLSANTAGGNGGGINGNSTIVSSILWLNTDSSGLVEPAQIYGTTEVTFSCIQDDDPCDTYIPFSADDNNNIDDDPMFVRDPNDGGDGWGVGGNDDLGNIHLRPGSPCIDGGNPYAWFAEGSVDIDGQKRVIGEAVDMGADEFLVAHITVTQPRGGEVWVAGSSHEIEWSSFAVGEVTILVSISGGANWQLIEGGLPNTGSYLWQLPVVNSTQCLVKVVPSVPGGDVAVVGSGLFGIHQDSAGALVESVWQSLGGGYRRAGLSDSNGPSTGCVKWKFEVDGAIAGSVTVGTGGRLHVACEDGKLYTLNANTTDPNGSVAWSYDTNTPLISSPSIGPDGTVYVGSEDGRLFAISMTGQLRWTHTTDGMIFSSPAVGADGKVYVCSANGTLYALGVDGSELWSFQTDDLGLPGAIFASPAIGADGTVYIGGLYDPNLYALDPNDGSVKWAHKFESGGWLFASPVIAEDGTIYQMLLDDRNLYAIDPNDGNELWASNMSDTDLKFFEPYEFDHFDVRYCRYVGGQFDIGNSSWSEPAIGPDGTIYVSLDDPNLRAVDPNDGSLKWVTPLGAMGGFTLTVGHDGLIYAASDDGYLYVVDPCGWDVARFAAGDWSNWPVISADNTIIISDSTNNTMLISHPNNAVWAIGGDGCEDRGLDFYWQGGIQDLDDSGAVDYNDLSILLADWLECTACASNPDYRSCSRYGSGDRRFKAGDINRDRYVDFLDFAILADRWLGGY